MDTTFQFFQVGNDYFENVVTYNRFGEPVIRIIARSKGYIKELIGKNGLKNMRKYVAFTVCPDNRKGSWSNTICNCYNLYNPPSYEPIEGDCNVTLDFIQHIFGRELVKISDTLTVPRYELGLDYLKLLYEHPTQPLPMLLLHSDDRQTGKSTFLRWLDEMFYWNTANIDTDQQLLSDFNAEWASKLIISIDEARLDKDAILSKIKRLSTTDKIVMNQKGVDQHQLPFFAKFIFATNDYNAPEGERRFWAIEVPKVDKINCQLLPQLIQEIPHFLHYISNRSYVTTCDSREWFSYDIAAQISSLSTPGL